jgi:hypothetical protein
MAGFDNRCRCRQSPSARRDLSTRLYGSCALGPRKHGPSQWRRRSSLSAVLPTAELAASLKLPRALRPTRLPSVRLQGTCRRRSTLGKHNRKTQAFCLCCRQLNRGYQVSLSNDVSQISGDARCSSSSSPPLCIIGIWLMTRAASVRSRCGKGPRFRRESPRPEGSLSRME